MKPAARHLTLLDTHVLGARSKMQVVRADRRDPRLWLQDAPLCSLLGQHQITHTGIVDARAPFRIVRVNQSGTYFMATLRGEGRVLVDGRWQACRAGAACLLPRYALNAFYAASPGPWHYCYVRYHQPPQQRPVSTVSSPVLAAFEGWPLHNAIAGLHAECLGAAAAAAMHHWVELIQLYVSRFAQPLRQDARLWHLWQRVACELKHQWNLKNLARAASMSAEHLRRLCQRELGRGPMHHVTFLRMQRAAELLATTNEKVETISHAVGYDDAGAFSTTFKKWMGWRPSEFRPEPLL